FALSLVQRVAAKISSVLTGIYFKLSGLGAKTERKRTPVLQRSNVLLEYGEILRNRLERIDLRVGEQCGKIDGGDTDVSADIEYGCGSNPGRDVVFPLVWRPHEYLV